MKKTVASWERKFGKPVVVCAGLCSAVILFDIIILAVDIIARYIFNHSISGVKELVELLMCFVSYLGIAYACMEEVHVQMTAFTDKMSFRQLQINRIFVYVVMFLYLCLMTVITWKVFKTAYITKETLRASVVIYSVIGKVAMPLGCIVAAIQSGFMLIGAVVRAIKEKPPVADENMCNEIAVECEKEGGQEQ